MPLCPRIQISSTACYLVRLFLVLWQFRVSFNPTGILYKAVRAALLSVHLYSLLRLSSYIWGCSTVVNWPRRIIILWHSRFCQFSVFLIHPYTRFLHLQTTKLCWSFSPSWWRSYTERAVRVDLAASLPLLAIIFLAFPALL